MTFVQSEEFVQIGKIKMEKTEARVLSVLSNDDSNVFIGDDMTSHYLVCCFSKSDSIHNALVFC